MSWKKHLTKVCKNCPLDLYVLALPWEIWSDRLGRRYTTYIYILMIHWIATNTTGSYCLKIDKRVVDHIIFHCMLEMSASSTNAKAHRCWPYVAKRTFFINSLIQKTVWSFLMRHLSLSEGGHFEQCKDHATYYMFDGCWDNTLRHGVDQNLHSTWAW